MARKMLYKERAQLLEASKPLVLAKSIFSAASISRVPVLLSRKRLLILFTHGTDCPRKAPKQVREDVLSRKEPRTGIGVSLRTSKERVDTFKRPPYALFFVF
jgi:hypothetical protein